MKGIFTIHNLRTRGAVVTRDPLAVEFLTLLKLYSLLLVIVFCFHEIIRVL
jgi:hypothetical protein